MVRQGIDLAETTGQTNPVMPAQAPPAKVKAATLWQAAVFGVVLGVDAIGHCLALATLCFAGALTGGLGVATATFLASTALVTLVLVRSSGFGNAIGIAQDTSIAILAPAVAYAATLAVGGEDVRIATGLAVIATASALSGLTFLAVGVLGLGRIVRLVPYPVAAGFLASSGYLLALAALMIVTETSSLAGAIAHLGTPAVWIGVLPAVALAAVLMVVVRYGLGSVGVLVVILTSITSFYVTIYSTGTGLAGARAQGLLPPVPGEDAVVASFFSLYALVDWSAVLVEAPLLMAVVLINLIGLLLNISGVELATRRDIDVNQELTVTGFANLAISAFGGATGYMTSGSTTVAQRIGIQSRVLGLSYVSVTALGCFFAGAIVTAVPVFVAAGLLMFIGLTMLDDWLVATRHRLMHTDWLIVLGIVLLTAALGILPAIGLGLGLAVLAFAVGYARLPLVRLASNASKRRSTLDRPLAEDALLGAQGQRIRILQLQGYLFFGSVEKLIDSLQAELRHSRKAEGKGAALILDFAAVSGLDSAGCAALGKLGYVARGHGVGVHLAAMPGDVLATIRRWDLEISPDSGLDLWQETDAALEACETALIAATQIGPSAISMGNMLAALGGPHPRIADLLALMEPVDLNVGDILIQHATQSGDVFFLEAGRLAVVVPGAQGQRIRVRSMAPGAVVGEVARYRDRMRTADVLAEMPSRVYRLSETSFARIEHDDRDLAALVHAILARSLSDKVVQTNRLVVHA